MGRIEENGGRFLKRSGDSPVWCEISHRKKLEKTSQALREGLDVRHKTVRPEKLFYKSAIKSARGTKNGKKQAKLVEGVVTELVKLNEVDDRDAVPDLVRDESPAQSFE